MDEINAETLTKLPHLKRVILESIRLRSPGVITRKVINPIKCKVCNV